MLGAIKAFSSKPFRRQSGDQPRPLSSPSFVCNLLHCIKVSIPEGSIARTAKQLLCIALKGAQRPTIFSTHFSIERTSLFNLEQQSSNERENWGKGKCPAISCLIEWSFCTLDTPFRAQCKWIILDKVLYTQIIPCLIYIKICQLGKPQNQN